MRQLLLPFQLDQRATFATFIAGEVNAPLIAYLQHATDANILLQVSAGEGLTHLLHAVCHTIPGSVYWPLRQNAVIPSALIASIAHLPLLAIDDIDVLAGNAAGEEMLFRIFHEANAVQTRLLFATHTPLAQVAIKLADLYSRLQSMLYLSLQPLPDADKVQLLCAQAQQRGFILPPKVAHYIMQQVPRDSHSLQGFLQRLDTLSLQTRRKITIPLVKILLENTRN